MKNDIQRFTKVYKLLNQKEQLTKTDLKTLNKKETDYFYKVVNERANSLKGEDLDKFYQHLDLIIDTSTRNQVWENNHSQIAWAISKFIKEFGRMPTKSEIALKTELSRQTVHKHLKEYSTHPSLIEHREQFRFMTDKLLAKVLLYALNGDMNAAKLYFNFTGISNTGNTFNNTLIQNQQNNFIQINGVILQLNYEQIQLIIQNLDLLPETQKLS